jgi:four helix bundle protein
LAERKPVYQSPGQSGKRGFEDLECYKLALYVIAEIYKMVKSLPPEEKFDLAVQIRRSSKSVTSNIAEGYGRYHYLDSLYKYSIARGELNETLSHVINAKVLGYIDQSMFESLYALIRETEQTLNGYMAYVQRQRAGSKEYGDKKISEEQAKYDTSLGETHSQNEEYTES